MHESSAPAAGVAGPPRLWKQWLLRLLAGLAFGFACNGAVQFLWLGLAVAAYGGLDNAWKGMRPTAAVTVAFAGYFASCPASFLGGLVAPLALGSGPRGRRAVMLSSACGGALAVGTAAALAGVAAWLCRQIDPHSLAFVWIAFGLGVPAGIGGGWLGGMVVRSRAEPNAAADRPRP